MALIRIKQINNSTATDGAVIAFDGNSNKWTNVATGAVLLPTGTTAERPATPVDGHSRYNSTTNRIEFRENGSWVNLGTTTPDQNLWETITADTGNATANSLTDTLTVTGGTDISTSIVGDVLTIDYTGVDIGENNTASNVGSTGVGVFKQKSGSDLEFKNISSGSNKISIVNDIINDEIDIDVNPGNINVSDLNNDSNFAPDQNVWSTFNADTGNATANSLTDTLTVTGGTDISTSIVGDVLTIDYAGLLTAGDISAVQVRRSSSYSVTTTFTNITFDIEDVNNSTDIEWDPINTDRILINETGFYKFSYNASFEINSQDSYSFRILINDTTIVNGSLRTIEDGNDTFDIGCDTIVQLTAGDYVTLQAASTFATNSTITSNTMVWNGFRLAGARGEPGPTGAGSNVIVSDEGVTVANTPHSTLNFIGDGVTATDAGSGQVDINITGGGMVGALFPMVFNFNGTMSNTWFNTTTSNGIPSNATFAMVPADCILRSITFTNSRTGIDQDIEIYSTALGTITQTLDYTWPLRNIRVAAKRDFASDLTFSLGDKIGVFSNDQGTNSNDVVLTLYFQIISDVLSEISDNNSGNFT